MASYLQFLSFYSSILSFIEDQVIPSQKKMKKKIRYWDGLDAFKQAPRLPIRTSNFFTFSSYSSFSFSSWYIYGLIDFNSLRSPVVVVVVVVVGRSLRRKQGGFHRYSWVILLVLIRQVIVTRKFM